MAAAAVARAGGLTVRRVDPSARELVRLLAPVEAEVRSELARHGDGAAALVAARFASARYLGQAHEIEVPLGPNFRRAFDAEHHRLYGQSAPERPVEVVALRVALRGRETAVRPARRPAIRRPAPRGTSHALVWQGRSRQVPLHERDALPAGAALRGPALLVEYSSTVLVAPGWEATVDRDRNLRLGRLSAP
jgi:N-methylhydantoinase A